MQLKRVMPLVLLMSLQLVACNSAGKSASETSSARSGGDSVQNLQFAEGRQQKSEINSYAEKIHSAVRENLDNPNLYRGKVCSIRLTLQRDGTVISATAEGGDPEFCKAALLAVKRAKIPAAPDERTWQVFNNALLDFKLSKKL